MTGDNRLLKLAEDLEPFVAGFRFADRNSLSLCESENWQSARRSHKPSRGRHFAHRIRHARKLTRRPIFYDKAKRALVEVYKRRSPIGLVGTRINVETGEWTNTDSHISAEIDSYYEYLLKCWKLFDDQDCKRMWDESIVAINKYLAHEFR